MVRTGATLLLGLFSVAIVALIRPGPVVRWLSRRFPDVLFHQRSPAPLVALSFDDSPHATLTPRILDVLAAHDARATFFMIGEHVAGNEEVVRRLVAEGHELGNHMMSDAPSARLPAAEFERQLLQTHELLAPFGPVRWFRPGHGWFNRRMLDQIHRHGYRCAMASAYAFEFLADLGAVRGATHPAQCPSRRGDRPPRRRRGPGADGRRAGAHPAGAGPSRLPGGDAVGACRGESGVTCRSGPRPPRAGGGLMWTRTAVRPR